MAGAPENPRRTTFEFQRGQRLALAAAPTPPFWGAPIPLQNQVLVEARAGGVEMLRVGHPIGAGQT